MSERDEVRELLANPPGLLGQLAQLGRIHRERCEWGLAAAESDELGEELAEEEVPLRWAAADTEELPLPVRYQGEGIELVVGLDENGPYICVVAGGPLQIPLLGLQLGTGEEAAFTMERAPASVVVVVGGQSLRLSGRSVGEPGER